ncbi:MAG: hypothetical protein JWQ44_2458 [Chthoniobacter sp.]|jgi:hypothetical protein|nr:hypothetical protein [Chthoniobacter sp.]
MRLADWRKITAGAYLRETLFAAEAASAAPLDNISERITVCAYPESHGRPETGAWSGGTFDSTPVGLAPFGENPG